MRKFRLAVWATIAILVSFLAWNQLSGGKIQQSASIGGPFNLIRTDGSAITDKDLIGKPHAIFFGFTNCPEVCPTTLFEASGWLKELGSDAESLAFYFFTVDPERDTKEVLAEYMSSFDSRITAITGTPEKMAKATSAYRVFVRKVPSEDDEDSEDYTVDHTATIYLMRADGTFSGTISYGESGETAIKKLQNLIKTGG